MPAKQTNVQELVPAALGTKAYYLTVEEPFDAADNCARTFGSKVGRGPR